MDNSKLILLDRKDIETLNDVLNKYRESLMTGDGANNRNEIIQKVDEIQDKINSSESASNEFSSLVPPEASPDVSAGDN